MWQKTTAAALPEGQKRKCVLIQAMPQPVTSE